MKPLIGISAHYNDQNSKLAENYYKSVIAAGGVPVIIPVVSDLRVIERIVQTLDGLLVSGGGDLHPKYFNQEPIEGSEDIDEYRDEYDLQLVEIASKYQLPILGICRGMQVINIAFGGDIYQDIHMQYDKNALNHSQSEAKNITTQDVKIFKDTLLNKIVEVEHLGINSIHHQSVKNIAEGFRAVAFTQDGVCEAIESIYYPILGVQWHPEHLSGVTDRRNIQLGDGEQNGLAENPNYKILKWLVYESEIYLRAKKIHRASYVFDSHCDTPMYFDNPDVSIVHNNPVYVTEEDSKEPYIYEIKVDAEKMIWGAVDAVFMVAYIPQKNLDDKSKQEAEQKAEYLLGRIISQAKNSGDKVRIVSSIEELTEAKNNCIPAIFLGVENGFPLGDDLNNVNRFYSLGVRYITLCHNGDNQICDSAMKSKNTHNGLSEFGRQVVERMNNLKMIVDISHAGESSFWDVISISKAPIIASHSCCKAIRNHPRNLTDEQIKAIADKNGVVQVCLYKHFLSDSGDTASVSDAIAHIKHIINLVGVDFVGLGSDFDGGGEIHGCMAENELINITKALIKEGFSDDEISKILGGNLIRVMKSVFCD